MSLSPDWLKPQFPFHSALNMASCITGMKPGFWSCELPLTSACRSALLLCNLFINHEKRLNHKLVSFSDWLKIKAFVWLFTMVLVYPGIHALFLALLSQSAVSENHMGHCHSFWITLWVAVASMASCHRTWNSCIRTPTTARFDLIFVGVLHMSKI